MLEQTLLADLTTEVNSSARLQHAVSCLRAHFGCTAVVLLKKQDDFLQPIASHGLVTEASGRRFKINEHPRLAMLLNARQAHLFPCDSELPDPYDGLLADHPKQGLAVHDCMGITLYIDAQCWGIITLDAASAGTFNQQSKHDLQGFSILLEAIIRTNRIERDNRALRQVSHSSGSTTSDPGSSEIIGRSDALMNTLAEVDLVARSDLPVLLLGETGTGKELIARRLHQQSQRSDQKMVYINCAALPESLAESEFFGHVKGAFSGASSARAGRFEAAHGSTLFLDEVGELPLSIQAKLLRVLQSGEIQRLGSDHCKHVDVRIIAATNRNLTQLVKEEQFRPDLYHRLSVYPVNMPPLRERGDDILQLAGYFLELNRARLGFRSLRLSVEAENTLLRYQWPGNVRELEHIISRAAVKALGLKPLSDSIVTIDESLLTHIVMPAPHDKVPDETYTTGSTAPLSMRQVLAQAQKGAIQQALEQHNQNWTLAARRLELDPSNLHKLAKKLGLKETG